MNYLASLILPATLGLVAGVAHGVVSHTMDLPMSLSDQILIPLESAQSPLGDSPLRD
ncbi:hypothetical protein S7335_2343 [Synechococcus sp. PCC 7335]|uniref:hypothetical protein n=1 Tax=Synechococcus sp. (strain ATCC 29403 / PCC 7335) TaxID=91464 RepID=UPI00017ED94C|nr:hypothetical protein [Synechococcus sp. PCC 7335]EDX84646.1 hypothetical protein S7335_2343 [Synechococcus sp. PCC 7335]